MRRLTFAPAFGGRLERNTTLSPGLDLRAGVFIALVAGAAVALCVAAALTSDAPTASQWTAFAVLTPLAAIAPLFAVSIARNHGFHSGAAFVVASVLVLPPVLVVALVLLLPLPTWVRDRPPWYVQAFNSGNYVVSGLAAWLAAAATGTDGELAFAVAGLAAATVFVIVNHGLLATMLRLGRGLTLRETGLFAREGLGIELVLALLGVAVGAFAADNPWLLPALLAPLALGHRSLSTLALLRESEERFRTMFEAAPTATMLFDADGKIVAANRSVETMLGYTEAELLGHSPREVRHPDDSEEGNRLFGELVRGERESLRREARYVRSDGETVVTQMAAALVRDADGRPDYVIAMAEDVTEQQQLEEQLRQSQKLEAIGRLAGGVAHDFNNILTAIGGYSSLALEHAAPGSPLRGDLDEIRKATDRATLLTRQLLAFSRKQTLQPELVDVNATVRELESMLRPLLGRHVRIDARLDPAVEPIEVDPSQLQQVVMNLVVNARDAMPDGGTIEVETANTEVEPGGEPTIEAGPYVALTVRDEGAGIDEATLRQIFEPFFTTKESGKGTGLGLATVYGIVKQSGGYIEVESEVGVGSAFTIYLPRAPVASAEANAAPSLRAGSIGSTVLVLEDEAALRELIRDVLESDGHRVLAAGSGEEAIALAAEHEFDLLLADLHMAGPGGEEVAARLRATRPALRVVYMSGHADAAPVQVGDAVTGAFLSKPFTISELSATVASALRRGTRLASP